MTNGSVKMDWMREQLDMLATRFPHYKLETFDVWKERRDAKLRQERAEKAKAANSVAGGPTWYCTGSMNVIGSTGSGKVGGPFIGTPANPAGNILYIVHGYEATPVSTFGIAPLPQVTFLVVTPDEDHAYEVARAHSREQHSVAHRPAKVFDYTSITKTVDGVASGPIVRL